MNVVRRAQARRDIDDIADYIARDSLPAAERFIIALSDTFDMLSRFPQAGSIARTPLARAAGVRQVVVKRHRFYVVYYRIGDTIEVVRVLHSARDREQIIESEV